MTVLHGGPFDGRTCNLKGTFDTIVAPEIIHGAAITHTYDAHTGNWQGITSTNGTNAISLKGGPADGKTVIQDSVTAIVPEIDYKIHGFIHHTYNGMTGEYIGIKLDEPHIRLAIDLFPRWTRLTHKIQQLRTLRLRYPKDTDA